MTTSTDNQEIDFKKKTTQMRCEYSLFEQDREKQQHHVDNTKLSKAQVDIYEQEKQIRKRNQNSKSFLPDINNPMERPEISSELVSSLNHYKKNTLAL